jgi:hypothetical protein
MSALFDLNSFITTLLFFICACTYVKLKAPSLLEGGKQQERNNTNGGGAPRGRKGLVKSVFWKAGRIGERLSPYVSIGCLIMAWRTFFYA